MNTYTPVIWDDDIDNYTQYLPVRVGNFLSVLW